MQSVMTEQEVTIGHGTLATLAEVLAKRQVRRVFLVSGKNAYTACGAAAIVELILAPYEVVRFNGVVPNPTIEAIQASVDLFRTQPADIVVAIGGGSAIDIAKLTALFSPLSGSIEPFITGQQPLPYSSIPLVAIPTTAGSGSEATHFAVAYVGAIKYSVAAPCLRPAVAIIDSNLTASLPPAVTAAAGIDALSQAVESYWSVKATPESQADAAAAIPLIFKHLPAAVNNPMPVDREAMGRAAYLAGKAINVSFTTACHAVAYPMTAHFGVAHGQAVSITLGSFLIFNSQVIEADVNDARGVSYVRRTLTDIVNICGADSPVAAAQKITELLRQIGLAAKLSELGITTPEQRELIIAEGFTPSRMGNNPRRVNTEQLRQLLSEIA